MRLQGRTVRILLVIEAVALVAVIILGVYLQFGKPQVAGSEKEDIRQEETESKDDDNHVDTEEFAEEFADTEDQELTFSQEVLDKVESMTTEEKVAQLFLTTPEALTHTGTVNVAGNITKEAIKTYPVGGLIYTAKNFQGQTQVKSLMEGTQQYSQERIGLPMFLAVQEYGGGDYSPLARKAEYEVQKTPLALSEEGNPETVGQASAAIADYLTKAGLNLNLAPFVGAATGEEDYDKRTYGDDISVIAAMAAESVHAYHEQGILTAAGTFPDKALKIENGLEDMDENDLLGYQAVIDAKTECLMIAGTRISLSGEEKPCFMSSEVVDYVREELGYKGILMTDLLDSETVTQQYSVSEAAVGAVKAGMNMLYCSQNFEEAYQGVLEAVNGQAISMDVLDESVARILTVKMELTEHGNEE